jgi:hypothetical protein
MMVSSGKAVFAWHERKKIVFPVVTRTFPVLSRRHSMLNGPIQVTQLGRCWRHMSFKGIR